MARSFFYKGVSHVVKKRTKHGFSKSPTYGIWCSMKQRCRNKNNKFFPYYGGRGIDYCERWENFKEFLEDMSERPNGKTLDRIDNNLGYYLENCRWETRKTQQNNRRVCNFITYNGQTKTIAQWSETLSIPYQTISNRFHLGWPIEKILSSNNHRNLSGLSLGGKANGLRNKAKTHCKWGHEFTPENTAPNGKDGNGRSCRKCRAIKEAKRRARIKNS